LYHYQYHYLYKTGFEHVVSLQLIHFLTLSHVIVYPVQLVLLMANIWSVHLAYLQVGAIVVGVFRIHEFVVIVIFLLQMMIYPNLCFSNYIYFVATTNALKSAFFHLFLFDFYSFINNDFVLLVLKINTIIITIIRTIYVDFHFRKLWHQLLHQNNKQLLMQFLAEKMLLLMQLQVAEKQQRFYPSLNHYLPTKKYSALHIILHWKWKYDKKSNNKILVILKFTHFTHLQKNIMILFYLPMMDYVWF